MISVAILYVQHFNPNITLPVTDRVAANKADLKITTNEHGDVKILQLTYLASMKLLHRSPWDKQMSLLVYTQRTFRSFVDGCFEIIYNNLISS